MAEKTLKLIFENGLDPTKEVIINIPRADDTKSGTVVKAAMDVMYDNYEIWTVNIGAVKAAKFVTPAVYSPVDLGI